MGKGVGEQEVTPGKCESYIVFLTQRTAKRWNSNFFFLSPDFLK